MIPFWWVSKTTDAASVNMHFAKADIGVQCVHLVNSRAIKPFEQLFYLDEAKQAVAKPAAKRRAQIVGHSPAKKPRAS